MINKAVLLAASLSTLALATSARAQEAGDSFVRVAASRTKLADRGEVQVGGATVAGADYRSRDSFHGTLTGGWFPIRGLAVEASVSTPETYDFVPHGTLEGTANLADEEVVVATAGASIHPFRGRISPYVGGGLQLQFTTQKRDALASGFRLPNASGPYVQAGVDVAMSDRWSLFAEGRKAFYDARVSGQLPLDATLTRYAPVGADAKMDPLTIQVGLKASFGQPGHASGAAPIGTDTTKWTVRGGLTSLELADKISLMVGGAPYPGAGLSTREHFTPTVQIGRFLTPNIAVAATVGVPPTINIYGAGSIGPLPKLGEVTYGPAVVTAQYHFTRSGLVRPYVGAGAAYMIVFHTKDGAFQNLRIHNDLAPALEAGSDFMVQQHLGLFADVKKAFLRPKSFGNFMGASVVGQTRLDAWAFSGGVAYHF